MKKNRRLYRFAKDTVAHTPILKMIALRSEERRVGKACGAR